MLHIVKTGEPGVLMMTLQDGDLLLNGGIAHGDFHHETVGLGLGQLVRALLFHRVLRGQDGVELAHGVSHAVDGHLPFLHHLEEGGLRLGRGAVHLVDEHDVGKDRAGMEVEVGGLHVEHVGAKHVAGHEVGRELHAAELCINKL